MGRPARVVVAGILLALAAFLVLAFATYAHSQVAGTGGEGRNLFGGLGAWIALGFIQMWGLVAFYVPALLIGYAIAVWREADLDNLGRRLTGAALLVPALSGLIHLLPLNRALDWLLIRWDHFQFGGLGGSLGGFLCAHAGPYDRAGTGVLVEHLGPWGAAGVLLCVGAAALLLMNIGLRSFARRTWMAVQTWKQAPALEMPERPGRVKPAFDPNAKQQPLKGRATTAIHEVTKRIAQDESTLPPDAEELLGKIRLQKQALARRTTGPGTSEPIAPFQDTPALTASNNTATAKAPGTMPAVSTPVVAPVAEPINQSEDEVAQSNAEPAKPKKKPKPRERTSDDPNAYVLPPVDLLDDLPEKRSAEHDAEKNQISRAIEEVFSHFDVGVQVVNATRGPVVTQYEIRLLDQSMRVQKVEGFEKDLAMKLGTEGIRIVAPLPNKTTIGIEVPNRVKEAVVMRDLVEEIDPGTMALPIVLGRDVVGKPMLGDLAKMPHLLVAGATGMGKSVCMNAMICSILLFKRPEEVKFIMIDPKMVELAGYEDIPHLLAPPITEMTKAHAALEWACRTMDERYEALRQTGVRDIKAYNDLTEDEMRFRLAKRELKPEDIPTGGEKMPYIVVLVDEYADLMMVNKEVEKSIVRLAAKSRACGIHVILTTQRPSADVVTGLIKSNLPSRICFRVVDKNNSRVVLDVSGAENLLGKGDLLFLQPGTSAPIRGQGVWLKDSEINAIIEHAKSQGRPTYNEDVQKVGAVQMEGGGGSGSSKGSEWLSDRQFHEAVQSMYRHNRSGADFFRRKLNIGYNKATAYVEQLEDLGFLGPQKGTSPREIIRTWDEWIEQLKGNGVTWDEEDDLYHNPLEIRQ
ncbi:MAG: DNA translocase FtsK [Planctomycetes bacterium]|nr:DNA translocase FtsK [Planctomycetota bacterium]